MRPAELCADETPHLPVMQHALAWLRDHERYEPEWVMTLLPTSPLRQPAHIRAAIELARETDADSVIGVDEMPAHFNPMRVVTIDEGGWARLFVGGQPVKRRRPAAGHAAGVGDERRDLPVQDHVPVRSRGAAPYGDRVAAMVMPPPYGVNLRRARRLGGGRADCSRRWRRFHSPCPEAATRNERGIYGACQRGHGSSRSVCWRRSRGSARLSISIASGIRMSGRASRLPPVSWRDKVRLQRRWARLTAHAWSRCIQACACSYMRSLTTVSLRSGLMQVALGGALVWLVFACARRIVPERAALVAALLAASPPVSSTLLTKFHPFTLDVALWCAAFLTLLAFSPDHPWRSACAAGLAIGLCVLTRPTILACVPVFGWWIWRRSDRQLRQTAARLAALLACAALVVAPWAWRNYECIGA